MQSMTSAEIRQSIVEHKEEWEEVCGQLFASAEERTFDFLAAPRVTDDQVVFDSTVYFCLWRGHMIGMVTHAAIQHFLNVAFQEDTPVDGLPATKGPFATKPFRLNPAAECPLAH